VPADDELFSEMGQGLAYGLRGKNSLEGMREGGEIFAISTHKAKPLFGGDVRVAMKRDGRFRIFSVKIT